jgi:hypothetical protein
MNPGVVIELIAALAAIAVSVINGFYAKKAAQEAREAALEAVGKTDEVIHMVDGTQSLILAELKEMTKESAGLAGELRGRDYTRAHMEERQDAKDAKDAK